MKIISLGACAGLALLVALTSQTSAHSMDCHLPISIPVNTNMMSGHDMSAEPSKTKTDKKHHVDMSHMVHDPQFGGAFFMAPNQTNHIEALYSKECGLRLVIFNAMTVPVGASDFGAFAIFEPKDEDAWETIRILMPSEDNTMLHSPTAVEIEGGFEIDLYVKFPDSDEPVLFTVKQAP